MNHFIQKESYGCGLYSIANALQDQSLILESRLDKSKNGNNVGQLSVWLQEDSYSCWVNVVKYNNEKKIKLFDLKPKFEEENISWIPFFIVIKNKKAKRSHMIGCRYMKDNKIIAHISTPLS